LLEIARPIVELTFDDSSLCTVNTMNTHQCLDKVCSGRRVAQLLHQCFRAKENATMLYWAAIFFVIALIAGIFGFMGLAATAAGAAKILFFVFLVLAIISFVFGRRMPT
jgi:uncharacterized membrane protein YtjA (UPF0391 family)